MARHFRPFNGTHLKCPDRSLRLEHRHLPPHSIVRCHDGATGGAKDDVCCLAGVRTQTQRMTPVRLHPLNVSPMPQEEDEGGEDGGGRSGRSLLSKAHHLASAAL